MCEEEFTLTWISGLHMVLLGKADLLLCSSEISTRLDKYSCTAAAASGNTEFILHIQEGNEKYN